MKKFIATTVGAVFALVSVGSSAALAQPYQQPYDHHDDHGNYPGGPQDHDHHWHHGDRFYGNRNVVDWRYHHLHEPPYGYEWVQDGHSFVLLNIGTGYIANVVIY
ncbi:MAG: RcnB family protein [Acidocella sp.]|nr:RcnB family protein [Acidocella sp.]